jgi:hypothetical protein
LRSADFIVERETQENRMSEKLNCRVSFTTPDGRHMQHTGSYATPYAAMQFVEAEVPGAVASAGINLTQPGIVWRNGKSDYTQQHEARQLSGDALGVCQSPTKACPPHTICARKPTAHYFAPGVIDGASPSAKLLDQDNGFVFETTWKDWAAGLLIVVILFAALGYVK